MKALQSVKGKVDKELALARSLLLDLEANETEAFLPIQEEIATILKVAFLSEGPQPGKQSQPRHKAGGAQRAGLPA